MKTGTKSLLFGVHNVIWHPITIVLAWRSLYKKWPSPKELICIIIHDWGYWGCEQMDDDAGQEHPVWAARVAHDLLGYEFAELCMCHSRHLARKINLEPSKLCWADKLSTAYDPWWFYLIRARLSGELHEYRENASASGFCPTDVSNREWFYKIRAYMQEQAVNQKSSTVYMQTKSECIKEEAL